MRAAAESNLTKLIAVVVAVVVIIGVASFYPQFEQGYQIKTAARLTCNDLIKLKRFPNPAAPDPYEEFKAKAKRVKVKLDSSMYSFEVEDLRAEASHVCRVRVEYPVVVEWAFIGDIVREIEPYKFNKVVRLTHQVANSM